MAKVLITTTKTNALTGGCAVHTLVVEFPDQTSADMAVTRVSIKKRDNYTQDAIVLED